MKKVTDATFKFFCRRVKYWLTQFGVKDYILFFDRTDTQCSAQLTINSIGRSLTFMLPHTLLDTSRASIEHSALHEVVHACVAQLCWLGTDRYVSERELEIAEEAVVCQITALVSNLSKPR